MNDARATITRGKFSLRESSKDMSEKISTLVDSAKGKADYVRDRIVDMAKQVDKAQEEFAIETNEGIHKFVSSLSRSVEDSAKLVDHKSQDFAVTTNELVSDIKDNMTGLSISSAAAEEKEKLRRAHEQVDPVVEGKKHRVESQLLHSIKLVN